MTTRIAVAALKISARAIKSGSYGCPLAPLLDWPPGRYRGDSEYPKQVFSWRRGTGSAHTDDNDDYTRGHTIIPRTNGTGDEKNANRENCGTPRDLGTFSPRRESQAADNSTLFLVAGRGRARESHIVRCIARTIVNKRVGASSWRGSSPDAPHNWVPLNGSRGHFDIYRVRVSPFSISFSRPPLAPPLFSPFFPLRPR